MLQSHSFIKNIHIWNWNFTRCWNRTCVTIAISPFVFSSSFIKRISLRSDRERLKRICAFKYNEPLNGYYCHLMRTIKSRGYTFVPRESSYCPVVVKRFAQNFVSCYTCHTSTVYNLVSKFLQSIMSMEILGWSIRIFPYMCSQARSSFPGCTIC